VIILKYLYCITFAGIKGPSLKDRERIKKCEEKKVAEENRASPELISVLRGPHFQQSIFFKFELVFRVATFASLP